MVVKKVAKKPAKTDKEVAEKEVGKVVHYYTHLKVAIIELKKGALTKGEQVHFKGATSDFSQKVASMQIDHKEVEKAPKGKSIGLKVKEHAREGDVVYIVE